jgi:quercetin dioxygenase-like cupin family protein
MAMDDDGARSVRPFAVGPGEGLSVRNPVGGVITFMSTSEGTGGELTAVHTVSAAGEGPPLHIHRDQDEFLYILEGSFRVRLADEVIEAAPGSLVFMPRGIPHTWQNVGVAPGHFFAGIVPASTAFEEFFRRYAELPTAERGVSAFARVAAETNAFEVIGPPLAESEPG